MNNPRYSRLTKAILATTVAVTLGQVANAAADVDIDDDGLIEISTLQQLDLMRYDLAGTSLNGDSTGCLKVISMRFLTFIYLALIVITPGYLVR